MRSIPVHPKRSAIAAAVLLACGLGVSTPGGAAESAKLQQLTLIHIGDIHGHVMPRPNLRSDGRGDKPEGGLARMYTLIEKIRREGNSKDGKKHTLLLNTGDTVQGSAEALYTRGQALVDVLNTFGIDGFAPGNWDFVYGTERFLEMVAGPKPLAPCGTVAANVRNAPAGYNADKPAAGTPCSTGTTVLPPYLIKDLGGVKVALLGFTTDRGPQVVGSAVTKGLCFLNAAPGFLGHAGRLRSRSGAAHPGRQAA